MEEPRSGYPAWLNASHCPPPFADYPVRIFSARTRKAGSVMLALRRYPRSAPGGPGTGRPLARGLAVLLGSGACAALPWAGVGGSPASASAAPAAAAPAGAAAAPAAPPPSRSVTVRTLADSGPGSLRAAIQA